jgi:hypothetical protein
MSTEPKNLTLTEKADAAFRQAAMKVIERAHQTGTPVIIWENGRVTERSAEEMKARLTPEMQSVEGQDMAQG